MKFLLIILFITNVSLFSQNNSTESLIVVHYDEGSKAGLMQLIYKYNFVNNVFAGREELLTVVGRKGDKDYIRCDKGSNTLYKDRYLISSIGNIIDLQERKVIYDGSAKLVRCSNDSIIFYTNDIFKGKYYSYFDLKTNTYSEIKSLTFKALLGKDVEFDRRVVPYKLEYFPKNSPKVTLMNDAGHGSVMAGKSRLDIPLYWIDDNTFLFPNMKVSDLEGNIVKYNLITKTSKELGKFNSLSSTASEYKFSRGLNSMVEFYFKDKLYMINPTKETMLISNYKEVDGNFAVEVEAKANGRAVFFKGKDAGRNHFQLTNFKSTPNYAAIVKEIVMGDESYQQGLSVYNVHQMKWENIDAEEIASLVGWIKQ
jgi:hypothetical protein